MISLRQLFIVAVALVSVVSTNLYASVAGKEAIVYRSAQNTAWIQDTNRRAPHVAYIAIEPNCYYCRLLFKELSPYIESGQLSARWIVGSFLSPSSQGKGAAMMDSANPYQQLVINEKNYSKDSGEGGVEGLTNISKSALNKLQRNNRFLSRYGFGTPVVVYRDKNKNYHVLEGLLSSSAIEKAVNEMDSEF